MISHVLDTSVYSQPLRRPQSQVAAAISRWTALGDAALAVSVVAYAETRIGIELSGSAPMLHRFLATLDGRLAVLPTDAAVWDAFVKMKAQQVRIGQPVGDMDLLIAATAVANGLIVATLNRRDFSRIRGVSWEDWST